MLAALEWHTDKGVRYLRVWVDGKTGGRWLIARHEAVAVLKRLHQRHESPRELRRLQTLRRWSHEQEIKPFFT